MDFAFPSTALSSLWGGGRLHDGLVFVRGYKRREKTGLEEKGKGYLQECGSLGGQSDPQCGSGSQDN